MVKSYDSVMRGIEYRYAPGAVPVSEAAIESLEREIGSELPSDYRHFLSTYGFTVGRVYTCYGDLDDPERVSRDKRVGLFYGLGSPTSRNLDELRRLYHGRGMPKRFLPIASSDAGEICLAVTGADTGRVYLWPLRELELEDDHYLIAYDFDHFIRSLRRVP
jgi:hypothetical protein